MTRMTSAVLLPALLSIAACNRGNSTAQADSSLNRDLTTASQVGGYPARDTLSAVERTPGYAAGYAAGAAAPAAVAPQRASVASSPTRTRSTSTHRTSSAGTRHTTSSSAGEVSSAGSGTVYRAPETHTVIQKHGKRDAAIGAAAGAIIGATTSRDKVKGGVIGGAAGAILGGVIGNNVDKKKKTVPIP